VSETTPPETGAGTEKRRSDRPAENNRWYAAERVSHTVASREEEDGKSVLISGCSHKGILNIVEWFKPDILVGGFHFSKLPLDEALVRYAKYLDSFQTTFYTCHCTGMAQYEFMKTYMERLYYLSAGQSIAV
jgi:metal-dependent hydrolase (beta-lactamase superfamily II)